MGFSAVDHHIIAWLNELVLQKKPSKQKFNSIDSPIVVVVVVFINTTMNVRIVYDDRHPLFDLVGMKLLSLSLLLLLLLLLLWIHSTTTMTNVVNFNVWFFQFDLLGFLSFYFSYFGVTIFFSIKYLYQWSITTTKRIHIAIGNIISFCLVYSFHLVNIIPLSLSLFFACFLSDSSITY